MGRARSFERTATLWQLLALSDDELERTDLVALNVAVAKEIPSLKDLDTERYCQIVDDWTEQFRRELPGRERNFHATPEKLKNDIRFFRVGMLQMFLNKVIGIRYIEEQRNLKAVHYDNPSDLFINGLIDTKQGTCASMPVLHAAMCRRMGWPVSLASAKSHLFSRFDDGEVVHNIEVTSTMPGSFGSPPDSHFIETSKLPPKARKGDLRKLTGRETAGAFVGLRARHYRDVKDMERADISYSLSRVLFPTHRHTYIGAMNPMLWRGSQLFDRGEVGHPDSLFEVFAPRILPQTFRVSMRPSDEIELTEPMFQNVT